MRSLSVGLLLGLFSAASALAADDNGFVPMFNGKDLEGWRHVNTDPSTWKVEGDMLICSGKPIGELRTQRMYQNFTMELEWRHMVPKGNAGVFVWADDITAKGQPFHRGIEVQVLENAYGKSNSFTTHGDIFPIHGAKMKPINGRGGGRAFPTEERSKPSPQWNHYRIECVDGNIKLSVNGKVVTEGTECSPHKGYICLESEGGVVHYRNVRIKELPGKEVAAEHVAIEERGYQCLYKGVDLSGFKVDGEAKNWQPADWVLKYKGNGGDKLVSEQKFTDYGFIVDVKRGKGTKSIQLGVRGTAVEIDPANETFAKLLSKPGTWDRIEGVVRGSNLMLTVNNKRVDKTIELKSGPELAPFTLWSTGPVDFANIYVREIGK